METVGCETWLFNTLSANPDLVALVGSRIYNGIAPQDVEFPFVVFDLNSNSDTNVIGASEKVLANSANYVVKAVTQEGRSFLQASKIAIQIEKAIQGKMGTVNFDGNTYQIGGCSRTSIIRYLEPLGEGKFATHYGGIYNLFSSE